MFPSSDSTRIAVLEERLSVYEQMMERIDNAIQKIGETSQNISKMLAVHNEKIEQCNRTDSLIVAMIEDIKRTSREQHEEISEELVKRIESVEEKVENIKKIKWMIVGMGTITAVIVATLSQLAGGMLVPSTPFNPQQFQQEKLTK